MKNISLPVWVCVALQQAIGYIWLSPMAFGRVFPVPYSFTPAYFMVSVAASLLITRMMAWLFPRLGIATLGKGLLMGALLWTAFTGPVLAAHEAGMGFSGPVLLVESSKELLAFLVTGAILAVWKPKKA